MKILMLADANSVHTIKWATSLAKCNLDIVIFSLSHCSTDAYNEYKKITVYDTRIEQDTIRKQSTNLSKLKYLTAIKKIKWIIKTTSPDIVHAHYASSYGLLGVLAGFHPLVTSVWGSDVYEFPNCSVIHKQVLKFSLWKSDLILSTSMAMAQETRKYTKKEIKITPFGVDLNEFKPLDVKKIFSPKYTVIGTIKSLESTYGIDNLIKAFAVSKKTIMKSTLKLLIVGSGSCENKLKNLVENLGIKKDVFFVGRVPHNEVPYYLNQMSVYVALSHSESFGVAVVEASSCEIPVVVSDVGGLPEVVDNAITGYVVPDNDVEAASKAISILALNKELRKKMGNSGRSKVNKLYNWNDNLQLLIDLYKHINQKNSIMEK